MTKHTPGPWHLLGAKTHTIGIAAAVDPGWGAIATVYASNNLPVGNANARLIASAPDLLEALEAIRGYCSGAAMIDGMGPGLSKQLEEIANEAIIAAAKGGD